jgi:hypothetical protein
MQHAALRIHTSVVSEQRNASRFRVVVEEPHISRNDFRVSLVVYLCVVSVIICELHLGINCVSVLFINDSLSSN